VIPAAAAFGVGMVGATIDAIGVMDAERTRISVIRDQALSSTAWPAGRAVTATDRKDSQEIADGLLTLPGVQEVVIEAQTPTGPEALAKAERPPSSPSISIGLLTGFADLDDKKTVELFGPTGERRGAIRMTIDSGYFAFKAADHIDHGLVTSVAAAAAVGGSIYLLLLTAAMRPLRRLVGYIDNIDPNVPPPPFDSGGLQGMQELVESLRRSFARLQELIGQRTLLGTRLAWAVESSKLVAWEQDLRTGSRWWSDTIRSLLALPDGDIPADIWERSLHPEDRGTVIDILDALLKGSATSYQAEYRMIRADGTVIWVEARGRVERNQADDPLRFSGTLGNISARKHALAQLVSLATKDQLTGLPNRTFIADLLGRAVIQAGAALRKVAVLQIDVDGFSAINRRIGKEQGDQMLSALAHRMLDVLPPTSTLARLSSDQFLTVLPDVGDHYQAARVSEALKHAASAPMLCGTIPTSITVSIGIALLPNDGADGETLMHAAEVACARANTAGGNRYLFHDATAEFDVARRFALEQALARAHLDGSLSVHYQPLVHGQNRQLSGVEALLRWHADGKMVPASDVVALGEATGAIVPIGLWILDAALSQTTAWAQAYGGTQPRVSINMSARQLADPAVADDILTALKKHGLPPAALEIEVAESVMAARRPGVVEKLARLRSAGVRIVLDGYGDGTASLLSLATLPLDGLKLDRAIIAEVPGRRSHENVVRAAVSLAQEIGLSLIAVGVEREDQRQFLVNLGIREMQGWLFGLAYEPDRFADRHLAQLAFRTTADANLMDPEP
jgi:diguanylate cyclase (GGDEF)-like protein